VNGGLDQLVSLGLGDNRMTAVRAPFVLPVLKTLVLAGNQIADVGGLVGAPQLQDLEMSGNLLRDLRSLPALPRLDDLLLARNQIVDLSGIQGAPNLTILDLSSNQVTDIGLLGALTGLTSLGLDSNRITDIGALSGLTRLQILGISQNQIVDLTPLAADAALVRLDAHDNRIERLDALGGRTFYALDLSGNRIVDPTLPAGIAFAALSYGRGSTPSTLDLGSNAIRDLTPLVASPALGKQMTLNLQGNPIDCAAQAGNIQALIARVAVLYTDCP